MLLLSDIKGGLVQKRLVRNENQK